MNYPLFALAANCSKFGIVTSGTWSMGVSGRLLCFAFRNVHLLVVLMGDTEGVEAFLSRVGWLQRISDVEI